MGSLTSAQRHSAGKTAINNPKRIVVDLAIGGGGFHGAHNGEAAIAILNHPHVSIANITGTSAGAVVGAIIKSSKSPEDAAQRHNHFWTQMDRQSQGAQLASSMNPFMHPIMKSYLVASWLEMTRGTSLHPKETFRRTLEDIIDQHRLQDTSGITLSINSVTLRDAAKGFHPQNVREHLHTGADLSIEAIIASGSLQILGSTNGHYDGAYASNPPLPGINPAFNPSAPTDRPLIVITADPYIGPDDTPIRSILDADLTLGGVFHDTRQLSAMAHRPVYIVRLQEAWPERTRTDPPPRMVNRLRQLGMEGALGTIKQIQHDRASGAHASFLDLEAA